MTIARELEILKADNVLIVEKLHKIKVPSLYVDSKAKAISEIKELIDMSATEKSNIPTYNPLAGAKIDSRAIETLKGISVWPTESRLINSPFGIRIDPFNGSRKFHHGIDIHGLLGRSNIFAWNAGKVVSTDSISGYGYTIKIDHGGGVTTFYGHLHPGTTIVSKNQQVSAGQTIAKLGSSGSRSTGPHLHFEVQIKGIPVDPIKDGYISQSRK